MHTLTLAVSMLLMAVKPSPPTCTTPLRPGWGRQAQDGATLLRPDVVQDGQLLPVELAEPLPCPAPGIGWMSQTYKTYPTPAGGMEAFLPVRLGTEPGVQKLVVSCPGKKISLDIPIVAGKFPESRLSVDPKFSAPPPPRVAQESAAIDAAFHKSEPRRLWTQSFVKPSQEVETSPFGVRRTFNSQTKSRHLGMDFDGKVGQPILAANDGVVALAAKDFFFVGNAVFLDHGERVYSMYFHMSEIKVATGDRITRGQVLGLVGSTGRATGPHVHMGVKISGTYVNPADVLSFVPALACAAAPVATDTSTPPTDR